jgi:tellurite resistance protein TehA-like permease
MPNRYTTLAALFALNVALFALSGVPALKNAHHGPKYVLGGIGWLGGLACTLVLIVLALTTLAQNLRRRRTAAGS